MAIIFFFFYPNKRGNRNFSACSVQFSFVKSIAWLSSGQNGCGLNGCMHQIYRWLLFFYFLRKQIIIGLSLCSRIWRTFQQRPADERPCWFYWRSFMALDLGWDVEGRGGRARRGVLSAYIIEVYKDVQKYGVGFSTQIINMGVVCKQEW